MTTIDTQLPVRAGDRPRASLQEMARAALDSVTATMITVMDWQYQTRERRQLLGLSDSALKDFGASRADAEREGTKPFWQR